MTKAPSVIIRYLGHACFLLSDEHRRVLIDPFLSGNPLLSSAPTGGAKSTTGNASTKGGDSTADSSFAADVSPEALISDPLPLDLILVTHAHGDHLGDAVEISRATAAPILATNEISLYAQQEGVGNAIPAHLGGVISRPFGSVKLVPAWHSSSARGDLRQLGAACGFVIHWGEHCVYHAGDTCLFGDMKLIGEAAAEDSPGGRLDCALLPIGGRFTMGIDDAVRAVSLLSPRLVVPMHYGTFDAIDVDPNDFQQKVTQRTTAECIILGIGEEHEL